VAGQPLAPESAATLRALLEEVVTAGTGRGAAVPGYRVAGKTGTAQKAVAGGYSRSGYVPSFVGFAPAARPVLVGVVAVDEPRGWEYHGGQVAAPLFAAIARQVLLYLGVRPDRTPPALWPGEIITVARGLSSHAEASSAAPSVAADRQGTARVQDNSIQVREATAAGGRVEVPAEAPAGPGSGQEASPPTQQLFPGRVLKAALGARR
jgi:membrane peptidoglycan carboxypeptidase